MQLNLMLATQPISIALYHLPAIINSGSELLPVADARTTSDLLIDTNTTPWLTQLQRYRFAIPVFSPLPFEQLSEPIPIAPPPPLPIRKSSSQRQAAFAWLAQQTEPFIQAAVIQATGLHRTTVNTLIADALKMELIEVAGRLSEGSWHACQYRWLGKPNPYQVT